MIIVGGWRYDGVRDVMGVAVSDGLLGCFVCI